MKVDIERLRVKWQGLIEKIKGLKSKIKARLPSLKNKSLLPRISYRNFISFNKLGKPRLLVGGIVIVAILSALFVQLKIKERIFKKAPPKEMTVSTEETGPGEPILVKVYKVQKRDFEDNLPLLGTIKGFKEINLKFEATGIVDSFNFKEGEKVEEGEIIATLNQKDALLKLKYNEIEFDKTRRLFDIGAITKAKLEQVRLELESAKRELDKTYLYAPRDGILGTKDVEVGELVTYNDKIATLIEAKEVFVEVGIIEKDIGKVRPAQSAKVAVDTYPDTEFTGNVDNISPVIEGKSRTQTARIKVKNPKGQLLPGMFARASVAVYKKEGAIVIPNTALDKTEEGYVVYVAKKSDEPKETIEHKKETGQDVQEEEGVVSGVPVEADYRAAEFFVVKEGLEEGDIVVIETQEKLKDGYKVIITETQEVVF